MVERSFTTERLKTAIAIDWGAMGKIVDEAEGGRRGIKERSDAPAVLPADSFFAHRPPTENCVSGCPPAK